MHAPLITFIVPTFNRAGVVSRAIDSVLRQRAAFDNRIEVIVVDDGSTDGTAAVLGRYATDVDVKIIRFPTNRGLGGARNAAIERASGKWCALLDSDNALLPDAAATLVHLLETVPEDIGVIWANSVDPQGRPTAVHSRKGRVPGIEILRAPLPGEHFSLVRSDLARRRLYPSLGTTHACEPAFWAAIARDQVFWISPEPLQYYETRGRDRFCSADSRLARAGELAACYRFTAGLVMDVAPAYGWRLKGKAAFYRSVAGDWGGAVGEALACLRGALHAVDVLPIAAACLAGPWLCRRLVALRQ